MYNHLNENVNKALLDLDSALCTWERGTGRESVLVLREAGGFVHRSVNGKPNVPDDVEDDLLWGLVR